MSKVFKGETWDKDEILEVSIDLEFKAVHQDEIAEEVHINRDVRGELWGTPNVQRADARSSKRD